MLFTKLTNLLSHVENYSSCRWEMKKSRPGAWVSNALCSFGFVLLKAGIARDFERTVQVLTSCTTNTHPSVLENS